MNLPVRLGQRVYGVTRNGDIIPTLIKEIALNEKTEAQSAFDEAFETGLNGIKHTRGMRYSFRVLEGNLPRIFHDFDAAFSTALAIVEDRLPDETLSVRENENLKSKHAQMLVSKDLMQAEIDEIAEFAKKETMNLFPGQEKESKIKPTDFPQHYIDPGTPVWVADTKKWQLIEGMVTEVCYAASLKRKLRYTCGKFVSFSVSEVFRTKKGALNYLEHQFRLLLPGTLDKQRVPIVQQLTEAERKRLQHERFEKIAKQMSEERRF